MIRLFAGIGLDRQTSSRLSQLAGGIPGARWVREGDLHLTLVFLGQVQEAFAADINDAFSALEHPGFSISVEGFGTFGHAKPHTLWAGVTLSDELSHLQKKVSQAAHSVGVEIEHRKFIPHITLARLTDSPMDRIQNFIAANSPLHLAPPPVRAFSLFQSLGTSDGNTYQKLLDYPLIRR